MLREQIYFGKEQKEIVIFDKNPFLHKVIFLSDMHSSTMEMIDYLDSNYNLSEYIIITVGDMWGDGIRGADGCPHDFYVILQEKSKALYIIQGNHDLPCDDMQKLVNRDKTPCYLENGKIYNTLIGKIGGVNGIISEKNHPYALPEKKYMELLQNLKNAEIILTHDTPAIQNKTIKRLIGQDTIFEQIKKLKPKFHIYGHCHHHEPIYFSDDIVFLNADARALIFE